MILVSLFPFQTNAVYTAGFMIAGIKFECDKGLVWDGIAMVVIFFFLNEFLFKFFLEIGCLISKEI